MLKVVIDTNVFISGILIEGSNPSIIIKASKRTRKFHIFISQEIIQEVLKVMQRLRIPKDIINDWEKIIKKDAIFVTTSKKIYAVKDDPSDNKFLECAIEANADYIITGDKHLKKLDKFEGIKIVNPKTFLNIILRYEE